MPTLPSGRRVEFSLDRFHALLGQMDARKAVAVTESLNTPDDLLHVMDTVYFGKDDGEPFFAGCVAGDWKTYAADWPVADREALLAWFGSPEARAKRAEAIGYIRALHLNGRSEPLSYPYSMVSGWAATGSALMQ